MFSVLFLPFGSFLASFSVFQSAKNAEATRARERTKKRNGANNNNLTTRATTKNMQSIQLHHKQNLSISTVFIPIEQGNSQRIVDDFFE